ncbi:MAG: carboxypeptidase-like regulatory domain-containing protein [Candidatus Micrarchaeota archaeon]
MANGDAGSGSNPLTPEGSDRYKELSGSLEEDGPKDKIMGALGGIGGAIKSNLKIVLALFVIIAIISAYFLLQPRTATLIVEATQLDSPGDAIAGATVTLQQDDGLIVAEAISDEIGNAKLSNVPADKDLVLKIAPIEANLVPYKKSIRLDAQSSSTVEAELERRNYLSVAKNAYEFTLAPGCSQKLEILVDNTLGSSDFETQLIAGFDLEDFIKTGEPMAIPAGGEETLLAIMQWPANANTQSERKGTLRLKYTNKKIDLKLKKTDKKPKLDVSFEKSETKDFRADEADLPVVKKTQVKVRNTGGTGAMPVTELSVSVTGDFAPWTKLDLTTLDEANAAGGIAPGTEVLFGITITVPAGTPKGPYTGQMIVSSACDKKPISLNAKIE